MFHRWYFLAACRTRRMVRRAGWLARVVFLVSLLPSPAVPAAEDGAFFFLQLTDPQFGMYAKNADFAQETANFEFAIATAKRLKPAFVIVTGDLANQGTDQKQNDAYQRICAKLDPSIRLYHVAGNHDVGNEPTPESLAAYTARYGPDHYSFRHGSLLGIVFNTTLLRSPQRAPQQAAEQEQWLRAELEKAKPDGVRHVVVFQHHPLFTAQADEADQYHNLPLAERRRCLDLFHAAGVRYVFAGHYHGNALARDGELEMVTTGAIGKPLRQDQSGLRIVIVRASGLEHRYYALGEIPHRIDVSVQAEPGR